jgi:SAM-dependent methyltransferase
MHALEKRVSIENIGGEDLPYSNEFVMASMVVTLHEIPPDVRVKVVEKAYQTLKSDGQLLILDFPYPSKLEASMRCSRFTIKIDFSSFELLLLDSFHVFYHSLRKRI